MSRDKKHIIQTEVEGVLTRGHWPTVHSFTSRGQEETNLLFHPEVLRTLTYKPHFPSWGDKPNYLLATSFHPEVLRTLNFKPTNQLLCPTVTDHLFPSWGQGFLTRGDKPWIVNHTFRPEETNLLTTSFRPEVKWFLTTSFRPEVKKRQTYFPTLPSIRYWPTVHLILTEVKRRQTNYSILCPSVSDQRTLTYWPPVTDQRTRVSVHQIPSIRPEEINHTYWPEDTDLQTYSFQTSKPQFSYLLSSWLILWLVLSCP